MSGSQLIVPIISIHHKSAGCQRTHDGAVELFLWVQDCF